jgi:hypothetical protein
MRAQEISMGRPSYHLGFTAASLRPELSRILAECYLDLGDWDLASARILSQNLLQSRSAASAVRMERELRQRLLALTKGQIEILARATVPDRASIAWLAATKTIQFVSEFASEVLRDKMSAHDTILRPSDYENYVESKSGFHPELVGLRPSSKNKLRQVLLRMLVEAGLLYSGPRGSLGTIQRPVISPTVTDAIAADDPRGLACFLVPDKEIECR